MNSKILVLAPDARQALHWAESERLSRRDWQYVSCIHNLRGVRGVRIKIYHGSGTFSARTYEAIELARAYIGAGFAEDYDAPTKRDGE